MDCCGALTEEDKAIPRANLKITTAQSDTFPDRGNVYIMSFSLENSVA